MNEAARFEVQVEGRTLQLDRQSRVVTFVNRNLEPYRGYHTFCRALPGILARKDTQVVIVGGTGKGYGQQPPEGTWKEAFLNELADGVDLSRAHFVDRVPYAKLVSLFQISSVHVYLTYPFVLSWSLLDAMSCGCAVVGSRTAPVEEVIKHEENGLLVDFFDPDALAGEVNRLLDDEDLRAQLSVQARATVMQNYRLEDCLAAQIDKVERLAAGTPA